MRQEKPQDERSQRGKKSFVECGGSGAGGRRIIIVNEATYRGRGVIMFECYAVCRKDRIRRTKRKRKRGRGIVAGQEGGAFGYGT